MMDYQVLFTLQAEALHALEAKAEALRIISSGSKGTMTKIRNSGLR
jgi:hypothetical protein